MSNGWRPIDDFEVAPSALADRELAALARLWIEQKTAIGQSVDLVKFTDRLKREWAIETGLIERLYALDRGITETLIENGINAALVSHRVTNAEATMALITDQQSVIDSVFAFVKGDRSLSTSYIKELHALFTQNQDFAEGRDQFGRTTQVELVKGEYKSRPNNPTLSDGREHEYCPPEHVASEMDRLIQMHLDHVGKVAPEVEAAWLHHRFVQIHPFQDGNGRVARALATMVFLKADWLPLVVRDSQRSGYIGALEQADNGDLRPLVSFFAGLQKKEFIAAVSLAKELARAERVNTRVAAIGERLARRRDSLAEEWKRAEAVATALHRVVRSRLDDVQGELDRALGPQSGFETFVEDQANHDSRSHYFQYQIISTAKELGYYANTRHYRSWVRLVVKDGSQSDILFSFHAIGHEFRGVLACTATGFRRVPTDDSRQVQGEAALCDEVFQINYLEGPEEIEQRFRHWLETAIERGLAWWEATAL